MEITGQPKTAIQIPCCLCGTLITPNPANQCGTCLAQQFDLKSILQRGPSGGDLTIYQCRQCRRFQHTDSYFCHHDPESPSLLALCLKNIPALTSNHAHRSHGLSSLTLVDSMWIWTEPHSMRLKVRLTIRADVGESNRSVTVQQRVPIEFHVQWKQCVDCNREFTNRTWHAVVQLRQKRRDESKKALLLLESAIARNAEVRKHVLRADTSRNGFDFYFMELMHAQAFASYLSSVYPMKIKTAQKLVSEDRRNNTANVKTTTVCDMVPLNRYDLIVCDKRAAKDGCGPGRLNGRMCLVEKVSSTLQLVDASPSRTNLQDCFADLYPEKYWKGEKHFRIVFSEKRLVRFVVMDVELCHGGSGGNNEYDDGDGFHKNGNGKYALADVEVARESDLGVSEETFQCITHLGNLLEIGDIVLGYDLVSAVLAGADEWSMKNAFNSNFNVPDIVLVKKVKGGGAGSSSQQETAETEKMEKKEKSKSSSSKRREKRKQKQEKKMKDLADTLERMGFTDKEHSDESDQDEWNAEENNNDDGDLENDLKLASEYGAIVEGNLGGDYE